MLSFAGLILLCGCLVLLKLVVLCWNVLILADFGRRLLDFVCNY